MAKRCYAALLSASLRSWHPHRGILAQGRLAREVQQRDPHGGRHAAVVRRLHRESLSNAAAKAPSPGPGCAAPRRT